SKKQISTKQEIKFNYGSLSNEEINTLTYKTLNGSIASVDSSGKIIGVGKGKTKIIVYSGDFNKEFDIEVVSPQISYQTHIQNYGWQNYVNNGELSGTTGKSLRLEGIKIKLDNLTYDGGIEYQTHVQNYGWQSWKSDNQMSGTSGQSLRLEGIRIRLTGELSEHYDIYYRTHTQNIGWLDWAKNGQESGSQGLSARLEGIQIQLVEKNSGNFNTSRSFVNGTNTNINYQVHVQNYGWQSYRSSGQLAGTTGESLRLEAFRSNISGTNLTGGITYQSHIQSIGWQGWKSNGELSGTSGQSLRMEALKINLTGELSSFFDIYYRAHVQDLGWLGWAKNGSGAGSQGASKRIEAIEIRLIRKGDNAPKESNGFYIPPKVEKPRLQKINGIYYIDGLIVVNKKYSLPSNYSPGENGEAGRAIRRMISDMQN
ncbi:Ig-like domain-containing protein, partial [Floricoccus penangensis]|uniref:Ig-like domain-containing protein n=1 Tax=Floricoccus penangensis TaxID=1859475 RepID=UPI000ABD958E